MRNPWALLLRASGLTSSVSTGPTASTNLKGLATSNTSFLEGASTIAHSAILDSVEQRVPRSLSPSSSWQYVTRPQIKHAETSAVIKGPGNQQAIVLAESTPTSECVPSTAYAELVTCIPAVDDSNVKSAINCRTTYSKTSGCDLDPSPSTTTFKSALTVGCDQDSCGQGGCGGAKETTKPAVPSGVDCKDCTTSDGLLFAPQSTVPASATDPTSGAFPSLAPRDLGNLTKRTLLEPGDFDDDYNDFMLAELAKARAQDHLVWHRTPDSGGASSARLWSFGRDAGNFAVERLSGCTVIILVSRMGIWMSHHWEAPSFQAWGGLGGLPMSIERDVMVGMFHGDRSGWYPGMNQYTGPIGYFNRDMYGRTENIMLPIIYTPSVDPDYYGPEFPPWKYPMEILRIRDLLESAYEVQVPVHTYDPIVGSAALKDNLFRTTSRGKIIVQYDPQNWLVTEEQNEGNNEGVCYQQEAVVRMWDDSGHMIYEDRFLAMPQQNALTNMQQHGKRSEETQIDWSQPYCGLPNSTESECQITSPPATTISAHTVGTSTVAAQTISADTYCQCGETIAGVETSTAQDGSRSVYCNNGGPSASRTKPAMTLPPASTCYVTSAPATTLLDKTVGSSVRHGETIPANTYCQCGKTVAGVMKSTGIDGGETFYCANGGAASTSPVTRSTPPTACKLTSAPATTWGTQTFPAETYCQCGDKIAGLDTSTGKNGGATVYCANGEGGNTAPVTTVWPKPSPGVSRSCRAHLKEVLDPNSSIGDYQLLPESGVQLFVDGVERMTKLYSGDMTTMFFLKPGDTGLDKYVGITFGNVGGANVSDAPTAQDGGTDKPTTSPVENIEYTKFQTVWAYGIDGDWDLIYIAGNNDTGKDPAAKPGVETYCEAGAWDLADAGPNRNLNCHFQC